jgi:hypothetical protein
VAHVDLEEVFEKTGWGDLPESLIDIFMAIPLWVPDVEDDEEEIIVYTRARNGHCMACNGPLGPTTMITLAPGGIVMIHCGGACYTDQQVMGWLEEQYSDMVDKVKFRGGHGDANDGDDDSQSSPEGSQ